MGRICEGKSTSGLQMSSGLRRLRYALCRGAVIVRLCVNSCYRPLKARSRSGKARAVGNSQRTRQVRRSGTVRWSYAGKMGLSRRYQSDRHIRTSDSPQHVPQLRRAPSTSQLREPGQLRRRARHCFTAIDKVPSCMSETSASVLYVAIPGTDTSEGAVHMPYHVDAYLHAIWYKCPSETLSTCSFMDN